MFIVTELYQQLSIIHRLAIPYWIIGGTLLGQVRHGAMIPWDDDIDIGIMKSDLELVETCLRKFIGEKENSSYQLWNTVHGLKFFNRKYPTVGTDIFIYELIDGKIVLSSERSRNFWKNDYFLPDELANLQLKPFGALQVYVPNNPNRYLILSYGSDCFTHGKLYYDHFNNRPLTSPKVPLNDIELDSVGNDF